MNSEGRYTTIKHNGSINKRVSSIGDVIMKAWESNERKCLFMHDLITLGGSVIEAEARLKKFDEHSLIVVLRDTSERHMRFEAEKKIITATTGVSKRILYSLNRGVETMLLTTHDFKYVGNQRSTLVLCC